MPSNFEFFKDINDEAYKLIIEGERSIKTNTETAGSLLRRALEKFINSLWDKSPELVSFAISRDGDKSYSLSDKIFYLSNRRLQQDNNINCECLWTRYLSDEERDYTRRDGAVIRREYDVISEKDKLKRVTDFVRILGNGFHHEDEGERTLSKTYENVVDGYKYFHMILKKQYGFDRLNFNLSNIPIEQYDIVKSYVPKDKDRTRCTREYIAKSIKSNNLGVMSTYWAIIREYRKENLDGNFLSRGCDTQVLAKKGISGIPIGMTQIDPITSYDDEKTPYYHIAYIFQREPYELEKVISTLSNEDKKQIATQIIKCLRNLHTSNPPIYHRLLNYSCIYLCDYTDIDEGWQSAVVKFDFSKIDSNILKTVNDAAVIAKNLLPQEGLKYIAPEWTNSPERADWGKVDIYALGALLIDLLSGEILRSVDGFENRDYFKKNINLETQMLLFDMVSYDCSERPDIQTVYNHFTTNSIFI